MADRHTRLLRAGDAERLAELISGDGTFQAPYQPVRDSSYATVPGQRGVVRDLLDQYAAGRAVPLMIMDEDGTPVGRITLTGIERGPFQSGRIGYWVASWANGRGLATMAVRDIARLAFDDLGLHRLEAGTLTDNLRSQRVLEKVGFRRFGIAPQYLQIAGEWRDHAMFQLLASDFRR